MSHWGCPFVWSVTMYVLANSTIASGSILIFSSQQADKIDALEVEQSWKEEEFDFVLQFLRTILMKREHVVIPLSYSFTDGSRRCISNIYV